MYLWEYGFSAHSFLLRTVAMILEPIRHEIGNGEGEPTQTSICLGVIMDFLARAAQFATEGYALYSKYFSSKGTNSWEDSLAVDK